MDAPGENDFCIVCICLLRSKRTRNASIDNRRTSSKGFGYAVEGTLAANALTLDSKPGSCVHDTDIGIRRFWSPSSLKLIEWDL